MNEIKFRAWDKFNDCMWYQTESLVIFLQNMQDLEDGENGIILEQYTGLKDKKGKEIYKGDIVKPLYVHEAYKDDICEIVFDQGSFSMRLIRDVHRFKPAISFVYYNLSGFEATGNPMINDGIVEVEIIGNIHQNADLL